MARSDPEALVREHGAFLRRLARELARGGGGDGREGDAEDLVQETWVQALRSPPDPTRPARPWLAEVLRNLWRMRYRGAGRREAREADAEALRDAPVDPEQALSRAETLALLSDRLTKLAEPLRTTLLLRHGEGMSAAAIAALQGIPSGTVRWRPCRRRRRRGCGSARLRRSAGAHPRCRRHHGHPRSGARRRVDSGAGGHPAEGHRDAVGRST